MIFQSCRIIVRLLAADCSTSEAPDFFASRVRNDAGRRLSQTLGDLSADIGLGGVERIGLDATDVFDNL